MIRPFGAEDAVEVAAFLAELDKGPATPEGLVHRVESMPTRADARFWVAVEEGAAVGWMEARRKWSSDPAIGKFWVAVRRSFRRSEVRSELWACALQHLRGLGVRTLTTYDDGTAETARFITARGFRPGRREVISVLEPEPVEVSAPAGARVLPLGNVSERDDELFLLYQAAEADMPADEAHGRMTLEEWQQETLEHPLLDRDGSFVVEVESRLAALTFLVVDRECGKAENEMTGTLPELRGRGLATLAKRASIAWAAANGIREIWTGNDEENAAMRAINRRLGYRPVKTLTDYSREAGTLAPGMPPAKEASPRAEDSTR